MTRKISCFLIFALLLCTLLALPSTAYDRISYGVDRLADRSELIKSGLRGSDIRFREADFKQALGVSRISSITLLSLPNLTDGVLKLNGQPAVAGQVIAQENLANLTFSPSSAAIDTASFEFCANSSAGTTALVCTLRILDSINYAPTVLNVKETALQFETRSGISVFGKMTAEDPEGDGLTYLVINYPSKGTLTETDGTSGAFRYTPYAGQTGNDAFSYVARDAYGNYSSVATVRIEIADMRGVAVYSDMGGHPAHNAAITLTEKEIMIGEIEGGGFCFRPDGEISRADFTVMAMKAAGIAPASGMKRTWFDDGAAISEAVTPYVATAQLYGYVNGNFDGNGLYFEPTRAITRAEAAVILNNILNADIPASLPVFADSSDIPAWARADIYALTEAGIFTPNREGSIAANSPLTRADAAMMLAALMEYSA